MLEAAGRLVPELRVVAFQREALAHRAQELCDEAQLVGEGSVQQKVCRSLEALDIPGLAVEDSVPHGEGLGGAAAPGCGIPQGAAAEADVLGVDDTAAINAVFLPQAGVNAVDVVALHEARQLRVQGVDALHDADAALEVQRLRLGGAGLGGEVVDGQHSLSGGAQIAEALANEGHIQRVGVLVVQRTVGQAGVILSALEEVIQTDDMGRGAGGFQSLGHLMS